MEVKSQFTIILPAYNEEKSVGKVVQAVRERFSSARVIVVNDGSSDKTESVAQDSGAIVLSHPFNCGVGAALRTGFIYSLTYPNDPVIVLDADGQHNPAEISRLVGAIKNQSIVVGCREWNTFDAHWSRKLAQRVVVKILRKKFNLGVSDPTSGFRLFAPGVVSRLVDHIEPEYLDDTVILLINAKLAGIEIIEVACSMNARISGKPSHNFVKSVVRYMAMVIKILLKGASR